MKAYHKLRGQSENRRFTGEYAEDGKAKRLNVRAEAGHRCIRCGHPFESGKHGKGEWSPCDEKCTHNGPMRKFLGGAMMEYLDPKGKPAGEYVKEGLFVDAQRGGSRLLCLNCRTCSGRGYVRSERRAR